MTTNNSSDQQFANNSDGFGLGGGTTVRTLTVTGANITLTGSGTNVYTFPAATDTLVGRASTDTLTNKIYDTAGTGNSFRINGTTISATVGSGPVVLASGAPTTIPTASTIAEWDGNKNFSSNTFIPAFTTTATASGTTTLTISATETQIFTGTLAQTVKLPTTSVIQGAQYTVINQSTGAVTVQSSGANTITILAAGTSAIFVAVVATPTTAANWASRYLGLVTTSGKVLTANNSLTLAGTDSTTMTFPSTSATIARTDSAQTLTGIQTFSSIPVFPNNTVLAPNLATNAISLGTTAITSTFNPGSGGATPQQVTSLTKTVTIPAGGRDAEITIFAPGLSSTAAPSATTHLQLWKGTVGSGTKLQEGTVIGASNGFGSGLTMIYVDPAPTAGSTTYNVGIFADAGNPQLVIPSGGSATIALKMI